MAPHDFSSIFDTLCLTQSELARLLSVNIRTVRRWVESPADIPGPAEQALRAWFALDRLGLPWAPDAVDVAQIGADQVAQSRAHAIELEALLERVEQRGGPAAPWAVNLAQRRAALGPLQVTFYRLPNGGFSPQSYSRKVGTADLKRDWPLLEDAFACIARAISDERKRKRNK